MTYKDKFVFKKGDQIVPITKDLIESTLAGSVFSVDNDRTHPKVNDYMITQIFINTNFNSPGVIVTIDLDQLETDARSWQNPAQPPCSRFAKVLVYFYDNVLC